MRLVFAAAIFAITVSASLSQAADFKVHQGLYFNFGNEPGYLFFTDNPKLAIRVNCDVTNFGKNARVIVYKDPTNIRYFNKSSVWFDEKVKVQGNCIEEMNKYKSASRENPMSFTVPGMPDIPGSTPRPESQPAPEGSPPANR